MSGNTLLHLIGVILRGQKPYTQTSGAEVEALRKYAQDALTATEIGVFEGSTTTILASSISKKGILYGIDSFNKGRLGICYGKLVALYWLKKHGVSKKVKLIEKLSTDAVGDVPDDIDFLFIDGDHSWDGIRQDWQQWAPKLKTGGIIALHDTAIPSYNPSIRTLDSVRYFEEIIKHDKNFMLKETVDSLNVLQKIN